jgi:Cadherin domain
MQLLCYRTGHDDDTVGDGGAGSGQKSGREMLKSESKRRLAVHVESDTVLMRIDPFGLGDDTDGLEAFTIDESTGTIRTKVTLDHEERAFYRLAVSVKDHGRPPKETVRQLQIEVLDLNDNRPTFSTSSFAFKVSHVTRART